MITVMLSTEHWVLYTYITNAMTDSPDANPVNLHEPAR